MKAGIIVIFTVLLISLGYILSISPYYGSAIILLLVFLIALGVYIFHLYFSTKDTAFTLFMFLIGGIAAQTRNFTYISVGPIFITEFVMIFLILAIITRLSISQRCNVIRGYYPNILSKILIVYFGGGLIYLTYNLLSLNELDFIECLRNFSLVYYSLFFFIAYFLFKELTIEKINKLFLTILFANTLRGIVVIIMYILNLETFIPKDGGIIGGPSSLISVFASLIAFHYLTFNKKWKLIYVSLFIANLFFTFLSGHRSSYIALAVSLLVYLLLLRRIRLVLPLSLAVFLLFVLSDFFKHIIPLFGDIFQRIIYNVNQLVYERISDPNAQWRYLYWSNVIREVTLKPWGLGFDYSLSKLAPWEVWAERPSELAFRASIRLDPHNSYIAILARVGFWGFLIFLSALILYVVAAIRASRSLNDERKFYALTIFSLFVAVATFANFNVTLEGPYHGIFFWIFMGISMAIYSHKYR